MKYIIPLVTMVMGGVVIYLLFPQTQEKIIVKQLIKRVNVPVEKVVYKTKYRCTRTKFKKRARGYYRYKGKLYYQY